MMVAVGIVPEAAFVQAVAGDLVDVVTLIPPGYSAANYQPSAGEMQALSEADVYFTMQMPTEEANILPKVGDFNPDMLIINLRDAAAAVYPLLTSTDHHEAGQSGEDAAIVDPHVWLSPKRAIVMVRAIADTLCSLDKAHEKIYQENADAYIEKLEDMDDKIRKITSALNNKSFLIYHAAYAYFADDYGLDMISIETQGKQATAAEMQHVIDLARQDGIRTVFYQQEFDDNQAKTVAEEIGGTVRETAPLSADYIGNLTALANALAESEGP